MNSAIDLTRSNTVVENIQYGSQSWQRLDVYPAQNSDAQTPTEAPVIVFFHGGGWSHGRKDQYAFAADAFLRLGYTVVLPDYVKYPASEAIFPAHVVDGAKAIAWVKKNITDYNGDPENIFISGHSAGAHTAALIATNNRFLNDEGMSPQEILGVAPIAGPYRYIPDTPASKSVFGPESNYPKINPLLYVSGDEPAVMILHSENDQSVPTRHLHEFSDAIESVNGKVKSKMYVDLSHVDMVTHLHPWFGGAETIANEIDQFFRMQIR